MLKTIDTNIKKLTKTMKAKLGIGYDNANGKKSNEATNLKASSEKKMDKKKKS
tara:strand:+ start:106 stop:264 length:159 start_codon:yes stop_codon:yes gene_type:complete